MRKINMRLLALILSTSIFSPAIAVELITGNGVAPASFTVNVEAKAFDRYTGHFYVGTTLANANSIARASRTATAFTGIGAAATLPLNGQMDIASTDGTGADYVGYKKTNNDAAGALSAIPAAGGTEFGTTVQQIKLADSNNATTFSLLTGAYYDGSIGPAITAGAYFFVRAQGAADMTPQGGIEAFLVTEGTPNTFTRIGQDTGGTDDDSAVKLDGVVNPGGNNGSPLKSGVGPLIVAVNTVNDMHWSPKLKTLFTASTLLTTADSDEIMAISKVEFQNNAAAKLTITNSYAEGTVPEGGNITAIFAARDSDIDRLQISLLKIRTMYTSTGNDYLIVNGGNGAVDTVGNLFSALRYDSTTGFVCENNNTKTALRNDFMLLGHLDGGNTGSLLIGGGNAPWAVTAESVASDMEVVGDTVYVSFAAMNRDEERDPGVWFSTAQFDKDGVIIGWTSWERVMPSQGDTFYDRTNFFAVDASNNKLWAVTQTAADEPKRVVRHAWVTSGFTPNTLPDVVTKSFGAGTYSDITCTLDIPMNTPGVTHVHDNTNYLTSLAMFGGYEKVDFAKTSKAINDGVAQSPTLDFSAAVNPNHYVQTTLAGAGTVRCLGASRNNVHPDSTYGYFFAGTDTGLWIWALNAGNHAGYNGRVAINATSAAPFNTTLASWYQFDTTIISGPVTTIDSDGAYIYLIEQDVTSVQGTIISKLWKIAVGENITAMQAAAVLIAQSGKDEIPANAIFTDFKFITDLNGNRDLPEPTCNKCILSTNVGAFYPTKRLSAFTTVVDGGATPNAPDVWESKEADKFIGKLFAPKRVPATPHLALDSDGICHRVIANTLIDDTRGLGYFQNTALSSFNSSSNLTDIGSARYTNGTNAGTAPLTYLNNRALAFWSDGGRRFYTRRNVSESWGNASEFKMLNSFPYNAKEWNMSEPFGSDDIKGQIIYWIENISGIGMILAGTPNGVIALQ